MSQTDMVRTYLRYARDIAKQYNLDPYAMMAVAGAESGWNPSAIGDNGQSFGYHQFYTHGAGGPNARQYLDPIKNITRAAQLMSKSGAAGKTGRAAIEAMVRNFERPADPSGEIQRAMGYYQQYGKMSPSGGGNLSSSVTAPMMGSQNTSDPFAESRQGLMSILMQRPIDPNAQSLQLINALQGMPNASDVQQGPSAGVSGVSSPIQYQGSSYTGNAGGSLLKPLGDTKYKLIGSPYQGTHTIGNWQSDNAVDLAVPVGTPIYATENGVIGNRIGSLGSNNPRMAGLRLTLQGKGNAFYYAHLSRLVVKAGQKVKRGQLLGYSGSANGVAHLHFGVENGNPLKLFGFG